MDNLDGCQKGFTVVQFTMTETVAIAVFLLLAGVYAVHLNSSNPRPLEPRRVHGLVSFIYDGDTLAIEGIQKKIRLWGVDAPERGKQGAHAATETLIKLAKGKRVSVIPIDTDRYGRMVGRVFLPDGREVNRLLIESGTVKEYCRYSKGFYGHCSNKF